MTPPVALATGWHERRLVVADGVVAAALALAVTIDLKTTPPPDSAAWQSPGPVAYALGLSLTLPIVVRRRFPRAVLLVMLSALLFCALLGVSEVYPAIGVGLAVYTVATTSDRRTTLAAGAAVLLATAATKLLLPARSMSGWIVDALVLGGACLLGATASRERAERARLSARARRLERDQEDQAQRAVATERARIAREMHDVVTHNLTVVAVQAGVARHMANGGPSPLRDAMRVIEGASRDALRDMRRMLGLMHSEGSHLLEPPPRLADLPSLVERMSGGDVDTRLVVRGRPRALPPYVELALYRVAQEGLTNVVRHAAPATASVVLTYDDDEVVSLDILDDGRTAGPLPPTSVGRGLAGLHERMLLAGGHLEHGPREVSGFRLHASVPGVTAAS
jgi:signal transduction histidine kinase